MSEKIEYVKDNDVAIFRVTYEDKKTATFDAVVDAVTGWQTDPAMTPAQFEPYLSVMIKWDSCSHFRIAENGYLHLCGVTDFKNHIFLMEWLYRKAFEVMGQEPQPGESW